MKKSLRTLVLVLLVAVMSVSTYIVAMAAEDIPPAIDEAIIYGEEPVYEEEPFANDEKMTAYSGDAVARITRDPDIDSGTRLGGNRISNIEGAPALRYDQSVVIPRVELTPVEDPEPTAEPETVYSPPPQTGAISFGGLFALGFALMACAGIGLKKGRRERATL